MNGATAKKIEFVRKDLKLTEEQWRMLEDLAEATNSLAPSGTNAHQPSWRTMVKRIADGDFILTPNRKKR